MDHAARVYDNVLEMLPSEENPSPLVRINALNPAPASGLALYAKLEWMNPFGSVKDRAAWEMIRDLEERGKLGPGGGSGKATSGRTIVEPTSGNTGLSNARAHERTTGPEIWRQTQGRVTHVFTSLGTCGTVTGLSRYLRTKNPGVKVYAVQPSPGHDVPGLRNTSELDVSKLFDRTLIDEIVEVDFEKAYTAALELARREGLLAGPSSGLIFEGARQVLGRDFGGAASEGAASGGATSGGGASGGGAPVAVMIFCDNVFKYVNTMVRHVPELAAE